MFKKQIITAIVLFTVTLFIASCGSENSESNTEKMEQTEETMYQCPMKCEGEKMYDKPGQCPVCNMDLIKVEGTHEQHENDTIH